MALAYGLGSAWHVYPQVLLRVKENELQYLKKEVQCLRDELQVMQKVGRQHQPWGSGRSRCQPKPAAVGLILFLGPPLSHYRQGNSMKGERAVTPKAYLLSVIQGHLTLRQNTLPAWLWVDSKCCQELGSCSLEYSLSDLPLTYSCLRQTVDVWWL